MTDQEIKDRLELKQNLFSVGRFLVDVVFIIGCFHIGSLRFHVDELEMKVKVLQADLVSIQVLQDSRK